MKQIKKYFDKEGNECLPEEAEKIVVQNINDGGKFISETTYYRKDSQNVTQQ